MTTMALPEEAEIRELVGDYASAAAAGGSRLEAASERLSDLTRRYRECPPLLEPIVGELLPGLATAVLRSLPLLDPEARGALLYAYHLLRARGYKRAVVHLPHDAAVLIPVLSALEAEDPLDRGDWHCRFVLLLWLSIVVLTPFRMSLLDPTAGHERVTSDRIFNVCTVYSAANDSCAEAAAFLASKFLTRPDASETYLGRFFEWAQSKNANLQDETLVSYGALASVAAVLKHGKREDLLPYVDRLFRWTVERDFASSRSAGVRKFGVKIVQRIGLVLLKPRPAAWRYTREKSSLVLNLNSTAERSSGVNRGGEDTEDTDDQEIPEQIEEMMERLLNGLRDTDNVVRWSAAKGVGRVSARLNRSHAGDVAAGTLDLFDPHEGDGAWHGGCLALAELGRRGILLRSHLAEACGVVLEALQYEEVRGHTPTGHHVRDAACYVCWAFVRAYDTDLNPYVDRLVIGLLTVAVFDREINCRLAARAAFEESVGRLRIINEENLEILTAEEFSLSTVKKAYLSAAPYVASVNEKYTTSLIDHLVEKKIDHWDINIRNLAAQSLHLLTKQSPQRIVNSVLPRLIEKSSSTDLNTRHGSIQAIGEVILALSQLENFDPPSRMMEDVKNVVPLLKSKYQFRGMGGELMRQACCSYIENLSRARVRFHSLPVIDDWLTLIEESLAHEVDAIRTTAVPALAAVYSEYLADDGRRETAEKRIVLTRKYCAQLSTVNASGPYSRMGFALVIGSLPSFALEECLDLVVHSLISCTVVTEPTLKWAESRRDALRGLTDVCSTVGVAKLESLSDPDLRNVFECFQRCLGEYTIEIRGDVGAMVREASMAGIQSLCKQCTRELPKVLTTDLMLELMAGVAQQAVEKIDRTRALAGKIFTSLLYWSPAIPHIPHCEELRKLFPQELITNDEDAESQGHKAVLWLYPYHTMPLFVQLLGFDTYRYHVMLGLTASAGALTESLAKHTTAALFAYISTLYVDDIPKIHSICDSILEVLKRNRHVDRVIVPALKFLDSLLSSGSINVVLEDSASEFALGVLECVGAEMVGCEMYKKLDCITVLCQLIQVGGNVCRRCFNKLVVHLCSANRYVRKSTASKLYDSLLIYGDATCVPPENLERVMSLLAETDWEGEVGVLRPVRNQLCLLTGVPQPTSVKRDVNLSSA